MRLGIFDEHQRRRCRARAARWRPWPASGRWDQWPTARSRPVRPAGWRLAEADVSAVPEASQRRAPTFRTMREIAERA